MNYVTKEIDLEVLESVNKELRSALEPMVPYKIDPLDFCREAHLVKNKHIKNVLDMLGLSDTWAIVRKGHSAYGLDTEFLFNLDKDSWLLYETYDEANSVAESVGLIDSIEIVNLNG